MISSISLYSMWLDWTNNTLVASSNGISSISWVPTPISLGWIQQVSHDHALHSHRSATCLRPYYLLLWSSENCIACVALYCLENSSWWLACPPSAHGTHILLDDVFSYHSCSQKHCFLIKETISSVQPIVHDSQDTAGKNESLVLAHAQAKWYEVVIALVFRLCLGSSHCTIKTNIPQVHHPVFGYGRVDRRYEKQWDVYRSSLCWQNQAPCSSILLANRSTTVSATLRLSRVCFL